MWTNRQLILIFIKPLWLLNLASSAISIWFISINGWPNALNTLLIKFLGYGAAVLYQAYFYKSVYFYYRNAGVSVKKMYLYSFSLDFVLYGFIVLAYYLISK
ncbi:hypothetical protein [Mucilaginibacter paludis]|uniref:Uncharacterized protein n=1 Tax=Mucilaginibacter paludis DSM 18603 TaxID=714943 RepID=H1Y1V0_9SPHI|nr:hypothetical protein [Mucilaginibacter paludis]EHQ25653.1 hypothetical protein Mucpa_1495 [Mucilaginibacter paludis DSM 18603]